MRLGDRRYAALKRLHVLSGLVPIGLFVAGHLAVNFTAWWGADTFNRVASRLDALPLVGWLELLGIGVPIAAHVVLGALLGNADQSFSEPSGYPRRWMRSLQRWTGGVLVVYVLYHVWSTRLSPEVRGGERDLFGIMSGQLAHPAVLAFYALGVLAACAHLGVGLHEVLYRLAPDRPRRAAAGLGWAAFTVLALIGLAALWAFSSPGARLVSAGAAAARAAP